MLDESTVVFPNNVISLLQPLLAGIDADITVKRRPLRNDDPNESVGIYGSVRQPDTQSLEIGHQNPHEPTISRYHLGIQGFVKDGDEERGLAIHAILSQKIWSVLYRNATVALNLPLLTVTDGNERVRRWGVENQRFLSTEIEGTFLYLSTLDFWVETSVE